MSGYIDVLEKIWPSPSKRCGIQHKRRSGFSLTESTSSFHFLLLNFIVLLKSQKGLLLRSLPPTALRIGLEIAEGHLLSR